MASYFLTRNNYYPEYAYFICAIHPEWDIQTSGVERVFLSEEDTEPASETPFSVRIASDIDNLVTLQAFLDNHGAVTVNTTKTTIQADGVDTVRFTITGQTNFAYKILKENLLLDSGNVVDGFLDFTSDDKATYFVELKLANDQTGYAKVAAQ